MQAVADSVGLPGALEMDPRRVWFGRGGYVERREDGSFAVYVRGEVIGLFDVEDVGSRDVLIAVALQDDERVRDEVARAFRVSLATVGRVRTRLVRGGFREVANTGHAPGAPTVRTEKLRQRLAKLFERDFGPRRAHRAVAKLASYGVVQSMHAQWLAERAESRAAQAENARQQQALALMPGSQLERNPAKIRAETANRPELSVAPTSTAVPTGPSDEVPAPRDLTDRSELSLVEVAPGREAVVQHVGSWMLLGLMQDLGVYDLAARARGDSVPLLALRVALDATAIALAIGEKCVEGVRRLETPSVGTLLRHGGGASPTWVRCVLHDFADAGSTLFQATVSQQLLTRAAEEDDPRLWLYIDNHLRPYTGQQVIRKGWRMQDKRAVPGTTDFYLHDEAGAPVWRMSSPSHDSLSTWFRPAVEFVHQVFDKKVKAVLAFDRGGAYPEAMKELRNAGAEFVTYERKPYPQIGATEFTQQLTITLASLPRQPILYRYLETPQKNLRFGRGRVRRIALLTEDGEQMNLLAVSALPAEELIRGHLARWGVQENQLKHEVERWGINQLDGRKVEEYPPDAIIPNPARRRLDRQLKLLCAAEGEARRRLAHLDQEDPDREKFERIIETALERQRDLEALRATVPTHAPVSETPLAGKLKRHELGYKNVLDSLRTVLANIESELAVKLAGHLTHPREAKKALANLFAAPGTIRPWSRSVMVRLMPAATADERRAFQPFLADLNAMKLTLPGDPDRRRLLWKLS